MPYIHSLVSDQVVTAQCRLFYPVFTCIKGDSPLSTESIADQPEVQRFPGERLQAARLAKGITVEKISSTLHLPGSYIHALENGELEKLPSIVFARGYIRSYSTLVDVDADEFIGYLDALYGQSQKTRTVRSVTKVRQQVKVGHPVVKTFSWLLGAVVISASVWWWNTQNSVIDPMSLLDEVDSAISVETSQGDTLVIPALDDSAPSEPSEVVVDSNPEAVASTTETDSQARSATAAAQATSDAVKASTEAAVDHEAVAAEAASQQDRTTALSHLTMNFGGECWVTVKDRDGKSLFNNVRRSGDNVDVTGNAPFSVLLGAANGVSRFKFNGEEIDLAPFSKNNVARLTLPLE